MKLNPRTLDNIHSPIGEAFAMIDERVDERPLLDMSQAAPSYAPAPAVIEHISAVAASSDGARYCPQEGLVHLREAFAAELSNAYDASIGIEQVMITAGCNQAFCLTASALASPGDEVILPRPFYFNHDMWLRLDGIVPVHMPTDNEGMADLGSCRELISDRTRAIVLVSPGNPTGVTMPPDLIADFASLARHHDVALIIDETYRSFRGTDDPAHELFGHRGWDDTVVSLHSFSKEFALPGYRVGAAVGHPALLAEVMKLLDCVAICAPRIGQEAAWAGLTKATDWRAERAAGVAERQIEFEKVMAQSPGGFELISAGAYFGWVRHGHASATMDVVRKLLVDHSVLAIPGHGFTGSDDGFIRFSFANLAIDAFPEFSARLTEAGNSL